MHSATDVTLISALMHMYSIQNFLFSSDVALISGQKCMHSATDVTLISALMHMYSIQNFVFRSVVELLSATITTVAFCLPVERGKLCACVQLRSSCSVQMLP
jgi:hypothetical protein